MQPFQEIKKLQKNPIRVEPFDRAIEAIDNEEYDKALIYLEQSIKDPGNDSSRLAEIYYSFGKVYYATDLTDLALENYDTAISYRGDDYRIWNSKGITLKSVKRYEESPNV